MKNRYVEKIAHLTIGLLILALIPFWFGLNLIWVSWIPAAFAIDYLDRWNDKVDEIESDDRFYSEDEVMHLLKVQRQMCCRAVESSIDMQKIMEIPIIDPVSTVDAYNQYYEENDH